MRHWLGLVIFLLACGAQVATAACSVSVPTVNFGTYTGTLLTPGATTVTVTCPLLTIYTIALNAGMGVGATTTTRMMTGPGSVMLAYQMFQNSSRTTNWGNTSGTDTVSGIGTGSAQTFQIYPQAAAGQTVVPGTYTDTITVSVTALLSGTVTTTFTVTATVPATCTLSASALSFGTYLGLQLNVTSTLTITCTNTTTYNVGLNAGLATGATVTTRKMTGPASATLSYAMFRDSARTLNWGNTVGTDTLSSTGNGSALLSSVFGQLAAGQQVTPGAYSDTIIVTVTY
jgi:spore coat protein U-like protein